MTAQINNNKERVVELVPQYSQIEAIIKQEIKGKLFSSSCVKKFQRLFKTCYFSPQNIMCTGIGFVNGLMQNGLNFH